MKSSILLASSIGIAHASLALYPSRGLPDSICSAASNRPFLPLSHYAPATSYCSREWPIATPVCGTTHSRLTETVTVKPSVTYTTQTEEGATTSTETRTAAAVTSCSTSTLNPEMARREAGSTLKKTTKNKSTMTIETTKTSPPPETRQQPHLKAKLSSLEKWPPHESRVLTVCRCIQINPTCTTKTILDPPTTVSASPDKEPHTVTQTVFTTTVNATVTLTPTVYQTSATCGLA